MTTLPEKQTYNLPGFGLMRIRLFPYAKRVYDFLEQYDHVSHLRRIDQLGPIRDVLPGAHHTRYEYLMAQLALITELCHLEGTLPAGLSLGRQRHTFGRLPGISKDPSNGEVLMVLALLGNIGHLPTTFSGERGFLKYLRDHSGARRAFRAGLPHAERRRFDEAVDSHDLYRFFYFIAFFLLNRYRRRDEGDEIVDFCQSVLRSYLANRNLSDDQALAALWRLYRSIRRLTYLALDSHYAPVPFSLDLASIFFSLDHYLTDVFLEDSAFQDVLARLEGVMRDTVYLAPLTLLNHSRISHSIHRRLADRKEGLDTITKFWHLLDPREGAEMLKSPASMPSLPDPRDVLVFSYDLDPAVATRVLRDPMRWEDSARAKIGLRSCRMAAEFDPGKRHLKVAAALVPDLDPLLAWKIGLRLSKQIVDFDLNLESEAKQAPGERFRNGLGLLRFLLPLMFGRNREYRLRARPVVSRSPLIWEYGSTKAAGLVNGYHSWAEENSILDEDGLNEVAMIRDALKTISYRGGPGGLCGSD